MKRITAIALLAIANFAMAGTSFAQSNGVQGEGPLRLYRGQAAASRRYLHDYKRNRQGSS